MNLIPQIENESRIFPPLPDEEGNDEFPPLPDEDGSDEFPPFPNEIND